MSSQETDIEVKAVDWSKPIEVVSTYPGEQKPTIEPARLIGVSELSNTSWPYVVETRLCINRCKADGSDWSANHYVRNVPSSLPADGKPTPQAEPHRPIPGDEVHEYREYCERDGADLKANPGIMVASGDYPLAYEPWFYAAGRAATKIGTDVYEGQDEIPSPDTMFDHILNRLSDALYDGGLKGECDITVKHLAALAEELVRLRSERAAEARPKCEACGRDPSDPIHIPGQGKTHDPVVTSSPPPAPDALKAEPPAPSRQEREAEERVPFDAAPGGGERVPWEYTSVATPGVDDLNRLGRDGWELCGITFNDSANGGRAFLKRVKQ